VDGLFATPAIAAGDLYVGYCQEDPATNPEDPTMGAIHLRLPDADGSFSGGMDFSYVGCQSESSGSVAGARQGPSLQGTWSGAVDGRPQEGAFAGNWSAAAGGYVGMYTVAAGKQHVVVPSCIEYFIAPRGTFELFPVGKTCPRASR
jgi:hypothetical protein